MSIRLSKYVFQGVQLSFIYVKLVKRDPFMKQQIGEDLRSHTESAFRYGGTCQSSGKLRCMHRPTLTMLREPMIYITFQSCGNLLGSFSTSARARPVIEIHLTNSPCLLSSFASSTSIPVSILTCQEILGIVVASERLQ